MRLVSSLATCLLVAGAALGAMHAPASHAKVARTAGLAPFQYDFRIVAFSMRATLTYAKASATTTYHLEGPSRTRPLYYFGPHPLDARLAWHGSFAAPLVDVVAKATYSSPDPTCATSIDYRPAGNKVQQVYVQLEPPRQRLRRISVGVGRIPLATPHAGQDAAPDPSGLPKCGKPVIDWYQDAVASAPGTGVTKPRFVVTAHKTVHFTDPGIESIDWSLAVTVERVGLKPIDCAHHPAC